MKKCLLLLCGMLLFTTMARDVKTVGSDLQKAYDGEMNATGKYLQFGKDADQKGYKSLAVLYRAIAESERIHADMQAALLRKMNLPVKYTQRKVVIGDIKNNLNDAIRVETNEFTEMYISYMRHAQRANMIEAVKVYNFANKAEVEHALLFNDVLKNPEAWKAPGKSFVICGNCGFTSQGKLTSAACVLCGAPGSKAKVFR